MKRKGTPAPAIVNERPAAFAAFFFAAGIGIAYYTNLPQIVGAVCAIICAVMFVVLLLRGAAHVFLWMYIGALFCGFLLLHSTLNVNYDGIVNHEKYVVSGVVYDKLPGEYTRYTLSDVELVGDEGPVAFKRRVYVYSKETAGFGDRVSFEAEAELPSGPRNPGVLDMRMYLASNNVGMSFFAYEMHVEQGTPAWYQFPFRLRLLLAEQIDSYYTPETAPVAKAMFLGIKNEIDDEVRDEFARTGVSHVLAISGLHILMIAAAFEWLLKKLKVSRNVRFSVCIALLCFYALLTGMAPSVWRAVLMCVMLLVGRWTLKKRDTLTFLGIAMLITLTINPAQLFLPGFTMSYGVVLGLLCLMPPISRAFHHIGFQGKAEGFLTASLAACAAAAPLTLYYFHSVSLISVAANFYAIPLTMIIVVMTGLCCIFSWIPPVAAILAFIPQVVIVLLRFVNAEVAKSPVGYMELWYFPFWAAMVVFGLIFLCSDYILLKRKAKGIVCAVLAVAMAVGLGVHYTHINDTVTEITILDVGTGNIVHVHTKQGDYLIDSGQTPQRSNLANYTENNPIQYDMAIVANDRTNNLTELIDGGYIENLLVREEYQPKAGDSKISMKRYRLYDTIDAGDGVTLTCIADDGKYTSFAVGVDGETVCVIANNTADVLEACVPQTQYLCPAKGGVDGALSDLLLIRAQPKNVILSDKEGSGLPGIETAALLQKYRYHAIETATDGAVTIRVDKQGNCTIKTMEKYG